MSHEERNLHALHFSRETRTILLGTIWSEYMDDDVTQAGLMENVYI